MWTRTILHKRIHGTNGFMNSQCKRFITVSYLCKYFVLRSSNWPCCFITPLSTFVKARIVQLRGLISLQLLSRRWLTWHLSRSLTKQYPHLLTKVQTLVKVRASATGMNCQLTSFRRMNPTNAYIVYLYYVATAAALHSFTLVPYI